MIRHMGKWSEVKEKIKGVMKARSDERILGSSMFVEKTLREADEKLEKRYLLKTQGYDLKRVAKRVSEVMKTDDEDIVHMNGRYPRLVEARSVFCYWAVRELGESATAIAQELHLTQPAVSIAVRRGERIVRERGYEL